MSVLPWPMLVGPGELTTAPSAMVSDPTRQAQNSPIVSEPSAFRTEPWPVTVATVMPPKASPTITSPFTFTAPPLEIVSVPGPPLVSPPT